MIHPDTELRSTENRGFGVFARSPIPAGTLLVVPDPMDQRLSHAAFLELPEPLRSQVETYLYHDAEGHMVLSWDHAKHINHCCHSNSLLTGYGVEVVIRDIEAGEEITTDYGLLNVQTGYELICDRKPCRGRLDLREAQGMTAMWDGLIRAALPLVQGVPQPLWPLVPLATREALQQFPQTYASVTRLFWEAP